MALRLATERPPAALVLRSPFASLAEVGRRHYPVLPVSLLLRDRYDSAALAGRLDALLVVAGGRDEIVPASHSRRLFDAAPQPKRLVVLDGADHNDDELLAGPGSWPSCGPSSTASAGCAAEPTRRGLPRPSRGRSRTRRSPILPSMPRSTRANGTDQGSVDPQAFDRRPEEVAAAQRFVRGGLTRGSDAWETALCSSPRP